METCCISWKEMAEMEILSMKNAVKMLAMVLAAALMLTALPATQAGAEPERPVEVNRTY